MAWAKQGLDGLRANLRGSGLPDRDLQCLIPALSTGLSGPTGFHHRLFERALAEKLEIDPSRVSCGLGASGVNALLFNALLSEDRELLCESPAYDCLWRSAQRYGKVRFFKRGSTIDTAALESVLSHSTVAVMITRPHNPSGADLSTEVLLELGDLADIHDLYVIIDEAYLDFVPGAVPASVLHERLISVSSLTKTYGLSLLRAGWCVHPPSLKSDLESTRNLQEVLAPAPSLVMATAALPMLSEWAKQAQDHVAKGRAIVQEQLAEFLQEPLPSYGPVGLIPALGDDLELTEILEARGIGVTPGSFFGVPGQVRISWAGPLDIVQLATSVMREELSKRV